MNIPSPAAVKKISDERKAREAELASSLANAKHKMPPTKGASKSPESSGKLASSKSRSSGQTHSRRGGSNRSAESNSKGSRPSTKSNRSTTGSSEALQERSSISTTPKKSSSTDSGRTTKNATPEPKKPYVRPEHLTQQPLRDNQALQSLRKELEKPARGQFKREYRVNGRNSGKSLNSKKENI